MRSGDYAATLRSGVSRSQHGLVSAVSGKNGETVQGHVSAGRTGGGADIRHSGTLAPLAAAVLFSSEKTRPSAWVSFGSWP